MTAKAAPAKPRSASRLILWGIAAVLVVSLALGGAWGWLWWQDRAEHRAAQAAADHAAFAEAEPLLRRVYERHPEDLVIVRALGLGYLAAHRFDDAELFLNRWCEMRPREMEPLLRRIDLWKLWQKSSKAVEDAQNALRIQPNELRGRLFLAQTLFLDARFDEAEHETLRCLHAQPDNGETWYLLATIYQRQGRTGEAADLVDRLLGTLPNSVPTLVLRADLHLEMGKVEPAIQLLTRAAASPALDRSFDIYQLNGQAFPYPLAVAEQTLDRTFVLYRLSQALARAGRDQEANNALTEMQWRRAMILWSDDKQRDVNTPLQGRVVDAYCAAGKLDEAVAFLTDILSRQPDASGTHLLLASCFDKQGQAERAAEQRRLSGQGQ